MMSMAASAELGYRKDEIDFILDIMEARDLVEADGGWVRKKPHPTVSIGALNEQVRCSNEMPICISEWAT
jgi:hypothetical protein